MEKSVCYYMNLGFLTRIQVIFNCSKSRVKFVLLTFAQKYIQNFEFFNIIGYECFATFGRPFFFKHLKIEHFSPYSLLGAAFPLPARHVQQQVVHCQNRLWNPAHSCLEREREVTVYILYNLQ